MAENFSNFYATMLAAAIDADDTTVTVDSAVGAPAPNFRLLVQNAEDDPTNRELMLVTAAVGESFTVQRGVEGTTAVAHAENSFVAHVVTAGSLLQGIYDRATNVTATIAVVIDGGDGVITPGHKTDISVNFIANIESWELLADRTGSIQIDIWKNTYANFPPTDADSITGGNEPAISGDLKATDDALTGWDLALEPGDVLRFNVDSATSIVRVTLLLHVTRS